MKKIIFSLMLVLLTICLFISCSSCPEVKEEEKIIYLQDSYDTNNIVEVDCTGLTYLSEIKFSIKSSQLYDSEIYYENTELYLTCGFFFDSAYYCVFYDKDDTDQESPLDITTEEIVNGETYIIYICN